MTNLKMFFQGDETKRKEEDACKPCQLSVMRNVFALVFGKFRSGLIQNNCMWLINEKKIQVSRQGRPPLSASNG